MKLSSAGAEKKLQRKVAELQEVRELDLQAKTHMEDSFRVMVEEKDEKINVLQTQVRRGGNEGGEGREGELADGLLKFNFSYVLLGGKSEMVL